MTGVLEQLRALGVISFCEFSVTFYAMPDVAACCVALQDRSGADVAMVLFCLWAGQAGLQLDAAALAGLDRVAARWRDSVVRPLRAVRRTLAGPVDPVDAAGALALKGRVAAAEREAEFLQLRAMELAGFGVASAVAPPVLARGNIEAYFQGSDAPQTAAAIGLLLARFAESLAP